MATLVTALSAATSNTTSSGYAMSGTTAIVEVQNDSTFGKEAAVVIQACSADTSAKYSNLDNQDGIMRGPGVRRIDLLAGMYIRIKLAGVVSGDGTSVNATITY